MNIDISGGHRLGDIGNNRALRGEQVKRTSTADRTLASGFSRLLENKKMETANVGKVKGDTLTLTGSSPMEQKLKELQELHEKTDYSSMSDVEIDKLLEDRYEAAFPRRRGKGYLDMDKYSAMWKQQEENFLDVIKNKNNIALHGEKAIERAKILLGYEGLSNDEIVKKVQEDVPDDGSLEQKAEIMGRLQMTGAISIEAYSAFTSTVFLIERQAYIDEFQPTSFNQEHFNVWKRNGGITDMDMSWRDVKECMYSSFDLAEEFGEEVRKEIDDLFNELIKD